MRKLALFITLLLCTSILWGCKYDVPTIETEPSLHLQPPDNTFPVNFTGYYDYFACFTGELDLSIVEPEVREYVQQVMTGQLPLMIPRCAAVPLPLREKDAIHIFPSETYGWLWTWFYTQIGQERVIIRISELSEAHRALAQGKTCSRFIAEIAPDAPNVGNYNEQSYSSVSEVSLRIGGRDVPALISETKTDKTSYIKFLWDGFLVTISATSGVVTEDWLETLSFGKITLVNDLNAKTLTNALQQCNTNYDYTEIAYDRDEEAWKIGFWENGAAIAAQAIMINETILHIQWAE